MDIVQIDEDGRLFISAAIQRWNVAASRGVDVVIDLEGGLDLCIPTQANHCLYVYFPFDDDDRMLPSLTKLRAIAQLAAALVRDGHTVLTHCSGGVNPTGAWGGGRREGRGGAGGAAAPPGRRGARPRPG